MTPETMVLITDRLMRNHHSCDCCDYCQLCAPWACGATSQQIMDAYLEPWSSREGYERDGASFPEFLAVLATAEYHEHWAHMDSTTFAPIAEEPTHCRNCDLAKVNHGPNGECADAEERYRAYRPCNCYYWMLTVHQCNSRKGQPVTQHWTPGTARQRVGGTFGS